MRRMTPIELKILRLVIPALNVQRIFFSIQQLPGRLIVGFRYAIDGLDAFVYFYHLYYFFVVHTFLHLVFDVVVSRQL